MLSSEPWSRVRKVARIVGWPGTDLGTYASRFASRDGHVFSGV
jgi:hypothetical protein